MLIQNHIKYLVIILLSLCFNSCSDNSSDDSSNPPVTENPPDDNNDDDGGDSIDPVSDEELLDIVQSETLNYFWEYAEPNSQMARERYHPNEGNDPIVTTGGSGFGLMALIVGIERGFISRSEAVQRLDHIADFLANTTTFHGA